MHECASTLMTSRRIFCHRIPTSALFWTYFGRLFAGVTRKCSNDSTWRPGISRQVLPRASFWRLMDVLVGEFGLKKKGVFGRVWVV